MSQEKILHKFARLAGGYQLTGRWSHVPVPPEIRRVRSCATSFLHLLTKHFSTAELVDARIVRRLPDGELVLNPVFGRPGTPFVAQRCADDNPISDLMTPRGMLLAEKPSVLAMLTPDILRSAGGAKMFVAASLKDAIVLRSLGLSAAVVDKLTRADVLLAGLEAYGIQRQTAAKSNAAAVASARPTFLIREPPATTTHGKAADRVNADKVSSEQVSSEQVSSEQVVAKNNVEGHRVHHAGFHEAGKEQERANAPSSAEERSEAIVSPGGRETARHTPPALVLVNWSPHELSFDSPPAIANLIEQFRALPCVEALDVTSLRVWTPTPEHREAIERALNERDVDETIEAVLTSFDVDACVLEDFGRPPPELKKPPAIISTLEDAYAQLLSAAKPSNPFYDRDAMLRAAKADLQRLVNSNLVMPLLALADATAEPIQRNEVALVATAIQSLYAEAPTLRQAAERTREAEFPRGTNANRDYFADCKSVLALLRDLKKSVGSASSG